MTNNLEVTEAGLESLFIGDVGFADIEAHLSRFNPIEVMGMADMEIRHSAILGWLLNPDENHGLSDKFLQSFLGKALSLPQGRPTVRALDVLQSDLSAAEVRVEWRNIDLTILDHTNRRAFIIENKFHAKQGKGQLKGYYEDLKRVFEERANREGPSVHADWSIQGIFLTLHGEQPDPDAADLYETIEYADILELLELVLRTEREALRPKIANFIQHYINSLRKRLNMDPETNALKSVAKELYRKHRDALEFIYEHGKTTEFGYATEALFGLKEKVFAERSIEGLKVAFFASDGRNASFLPISWFEALGGTQHKWKGCQKYWTGLPIITWLHLSEDKNNKYTIRLVAEVGPVENRAALIAAIENASAGTSFKFQADAKNPGKRYSRLLPRNSIGIDDVQDPSQIEVAMRQAIKRFAEQLNALAPVLKEFREAELAAGNIQ